MSAEFTGYMIDETQLYNEFDYHSIARSKAFDECTKFFNIEDEKTRKILLAVNEADQELIMKSLASKLYEHIVNKIDDVDFGTIPLSKGDIEKIDRYEQLVDCINVLTQVLQNYHQDTSSVDTVNIALQNMIDHKEIFKQAYRLNVEMPIITYNTMALSIICSVSLLISAHIEFIKMNDNKGYNIAFDKASKVKSKDKLLFKTLEDFNKMCSSGEFDKTMDYVIKNNMRMKHEAYYAEDSEAVNESIGGILGTAAGSMMANAPMATSKIIAGIGGFAGAHPVVAGIAGVIIGIIALFWLLRKAIYFFFYARTKLSDYFDLQSALLYMNAMNIENSLTRDDKEKEKTIAKQRSLANAFQKLAEKLKVKEKTAEAKAESDIKKDDSQKFNINDVVDSTPDSANAVLF